MVTIIKFLDTDTEDMDTIAAVGGRRSAITCACAQSTSFIRSPVEGSPGTMAAAPPFPSGTFVLRLMMTPENMYRQQYIYKGAVASERGSAGCLMDWWVCHKQQQ